MNSRFTPRRLPPPISATSRSISADGSSPIEKQQLLISLFFEGSTSTSELEQANRGFLIGDHWCDPMAAEVQYEKRILASFAVFVLRFEVFFGYFIATKVVVVDVLYWEVILLFLAEWILVHL